MQWQKNIRVCLVQNASDVKEMHNHFRAKGQLELQYSIGKSNSSIAAKEIDVIAPFPDSRKAVNEPCHQK